MDGRRDAFDGARVLVASRAPRAAAPPDIRSRDRARASRARSAAGRRPPRRVHRRVRRPGHRRRLIHRASGAPQAPLDRARPGPGVAVESHPARPRSVRARHPTGPRTRRTHRTLPPGGRPMAKRTVGGEPLRAHRSRIRRRRRLAGARRFGGLRETSHDDAARVDGLTPGAAERDAERREDGRRCGRCQMPRVRSRRRRG